MLFQHATAAPNLRTLPGTDRGAVSRALAKNPADRWPTCVALIEGLMDATSGSQSDDTIQNMTGSSLLMRRARLSRPAGNAPRPGPAIGPAPPADNPWPARTGVRTPADQHPADEVIDLTLTPPAISDAPTVSTPPALWPGMPSPVRPASAGRLLSSTLRGSSGLTRPAGVRTVGSTRLTTIHSIVPVVGARGRSRYRRRLPPDRGRVHRDGGPGGHPRRVRPARPRRPGPHGRRVGVPIPGPADGRVARPQSVRLAGPLVGPARPGPTPGRPFCACPSRPASSHGSPGGRPGPRSRSGFRTTARPSARR